MSDVYDGYTKIKTPEGTILKVGYKGTPPSTADLQDVINQYDTLPGAQKSFATGADKPDPNDPFVGPRLAPQKPLTAQQPNTPQFFKNVGRNAKQILSDVGGYGSNLLNTAVQSAGIDEADLPENASRVAQPIKTFVKANAAIAPRAAKIQTIIARMHQIADRGTPEAAKEYAGHVAQLKAMGVPASAYGATTPQQDSAATVDLAKQAGNFAYNNPIDAGMIALGGLGETAEGIGSAARIAEAMNAGSKAARVAKIADTVARLSHGAATGGVSGIVRAARGGATAEEAANAASVSRALEPPTSLPESSATTGLQAAKASKPILPPPAETAANPLQALTTAEAAIPKPQPVETPTTKRAIARMASKGAGKPVQPPVATPEITSPPELTNDTEKAIFGQITNHLDAQISSGTAAPEEAHALVTRIAGNAASLPESEPIEPAPEPASGSPDSGSELPTGEVQPAAKPPANRRTRTPKPATSTAQSENSQAAPGSSSPEGKPAETVATGTQNEPVSRTDAEAPVKAPGSPVQAGKAIKLPITQNEAFTVQDSLPPKLRGKLSAALKSKGVASVDLTPSEVEEVRAANSGTKYPSDPDVKSLRAKLMEMKGAAPERGTRLATEPPKMAGGAPSSDPFRGMKTAIAKAKNVIPAAKQSLFSDAVQESIDNTKAVTGNFFNRRFSRTIKESPPTYDAVRQMAGAKGQAHVSALTSLPQISEAMNRGTAGIKQFNSLMVENRLRGIRKMWQEAATGVQSIDATAAGIGKSYAKDLRNMVANAGDRSGVTGALKDADAFAKAKDYQGLKDHLENVFASSASNVPAVPLGPKAGAFETETARPEFQKALKIYQDQMEGPMKESHLSNGGVISGHLGPLDTYYPLIAEEANPKGATKLASGSVTVGNSPEPIGLRGRTGSTAPEFKAPLNRHNQFATGLADRYSVDPKHLLTEMARSYRTNSRANLINVARSEGILTDLPKGVQTGPDQITYKGRQVPATTVMTKAPLTIAMKGKTFTKPGAYAVMPTSLYREMHEMLDPNFVPKDDANIGRNVIGFLNGIAVKGFAEPVFHGTNVLGTLVNNTPFVGLGEATIHGTPLPKVLQGMQKVLGENFFTKGVNAVYNLGKIKTDTPEFAKDMMRLGKMGLVPTRTGEITTSAKYAAMTGTKQVKGLGVLSAALFGPSGLDTRARVLMLRIADQAAPLASETEKAKFVEQLGLYNHELEAKLTTGAKYTGLGPFATAGVQMNKNAVTGLFGRSPLPRSGNTTMQHVRNRIGQLSASGLGGVASWMVTHKAATGKWPWQDKNARPMAIPVPNSIKNSAIGKQLWKGPGTAYVSMDILNPLVSRALRATGLGPAALAFQQAPRGSKFGIATEEGLKSIFNSNIHPYISGTATRAAFNMAGIEPSLTGIRDSMTGKIGPQFFPSSDTKQPGIPQIKENIKETFLNLNPSIGNAAEDLGFGRQQGKSAPHGRQIGKAIADIIAPRAISGTYDANEASGRYDKMIRRIKSKEGKSGIKLAPGGLNAIR